jgi:hypothetical protein
MVKRVRLKMEVIVFAPARPRGMRIVLVLLRLRVIGRAILIAPITFHAANGSAKAANQ